MRGEPIRWLHEVIAAGPKKHCILWPFGTTAQGYGQVYLIDGESMLAHRYVCQQQHGDPPSPDHEAAHRCGTKRCVNPGCLRWATSVENSADMVLHGTRLRGESATGAKLTEKQVKKIFKNPSGLSPQGLADQFGVARATIRDIQEKRTWRHIHA